MYLKRTKRKENSVEKLDVWEKTGWLRVIIPGLVLEVAELLQEQRWVLVRERGDRPRPKGRVWLGHKGRERWWQLRIKVSVNSQGRYFPVVVVEMGPRSCWVKC